MNKVRQMGCFLLGLVLIMWLYPANGGDTMVQKGDGTITETLTYTSSLLLQVWEREKVRPVLAATLPDENRDEQVIAADKKRPAHYLQKFRGNISAYTNGLRETGKTSRHPDYGITASGHRTKAGVTVAAGRHIPFGTVIYIEGIGYRTVHDRGGAIHGNKIDVFMSNMNQVRKFGRRHLDVYIVKWGDGKRKRR